MPGQATTKTFWEHIANADLEELKDFCEFKDDETGYTGSYAADVDEFALALQENARKISNDYEFVENIWDAGLSGDAGEIIEEIRKRFLGFHLINNELANIAVFSLVCDYGYAGGVNSIKYLMEYDVYAARVNERAFEKPEDDDADEEDDDAEIEELDEIVAEVEEEEEETEDEEEEEEIMPAPFYLVLHWIGKDYCKSDDPKCEHCPVSDNCHYYFQN